MKIAILETVKATAGFELEFDRIIIETLRQEGHEPLLFIPEKTRLDQNFHTPIIYLSGGKIVSYDRAGWLEKLWLSVEREYRRVKWFGSALEKAGEEQVDAILLTTATYRYLRSLKYSKLKTSHIPVYFIFLGIKPSEKSGFLQKAKECLPYKNIKLCVTTLRDDFGKKLPVNVKLISPPVMVPPNRGAGTINCDERIIDQRPLRIGFFGHYRSGEKNLDYIFKTVQQVDFKREVQFTIQIVPITDRDHAEVRAIVEKYKNNSRFKFITKKLLGDDWYQAIQSVDAVILPYMAERYRYNWSAIYFTAIGCYKTVLVTEILNPEVIKKFRIGEIIDVENLTTFSAQIEQFVNNYAYKRLQYKSELDRANEYYSKKRFIDNLFG